MQRSTTTKALIVSSLRRSAIRWQPFAWVLRVIFFGALLTPAMASTITGQVINRSTSRPCVSDEVILYRVDQSMHEEARTRSDKRGGFQFENRNDGRYLIAVLHQGVSYHTRTMRGTSSIEISVYDKVPLLKQVREDSDTLFFEGSSGSLSVTEFFVLSNQSNPPHTLVSTSTFEFALPRQAVLDSVTVQPPETLPLKTNALPCEGPGRYRIAYPLRPGVTRVRVLYHMPYSGRAPLALVVLRPVAAMALMVPKSMHLTAVQRDAFEQRGEENGFSMYVAKNLQPGSSPAFILSGRGELGDVSKAKPPAETTLSPTALEQSVPDFFPNPTKSEFVGIRNSTLILCFEIPTLLTALLISLGALKHSRPSRR